VGGERKGRQLERGRKEGNGGEGNGWEREEKKRGKR